MKGNKPEIRDEANTIDHLISNAIQQTVFDLETQIITSCRFFPAGEPIQNTFRQPRLVIIV